MRKKMLIDATHAEETRVVVVDGQKVDEFDFETIHRRQLAGNIYLAKVTRVEPSLQAAFVDYGGNRHGFLAFAEIHPDYYQIPVEDRRALLEEERAYAEAQLEDEGGNGEGEKRSRRRSGRKGSTKKGFEDKGAAQHAADSAQPETPGEGVAGAETVTEASAETITGTTSDSAPQAMDAAAEPADSPASVGAQFTDTGVSASQEPAAEPISTEPATAESAETIADVSQATVAGPAEATPAEGAAAGGEPATDSASEKQPGSPGRDPQAPMPAPVEGKDPVATREIGGMDIVDLGEPGEGDATEALAAPAGRDGDGNDNGEPKPYRAADHAAEIDDQIESVADEDVSDELRPPRRPRQRRYKIQEVIKVRQIMLVQVIKEERGNKGAALTTYLSLAGRYCVLMPNTARGGGISRKITNAADRKKLKQIAGELEVPQGAGLIIRTAGANRTKAEIRRDYEYLSRLWDQIRDLTLKSIAPAPIYEEGDLIKRSIRDLYSREIDEVLVEGETGYRVAKDFMKMIMPSHARNVKLYNDPMPLFARYQVESYLAGMFNPTVQLKSGGYIVIGITEALVAIDVNSGKATRQGSIEETALQTNLEAAEEIARQLRLRDLAGLIVIDFIDMEERKNNNAVEKKLKDRLKDDRARIQVGRISGFGLLEMSRQRLRPGMLEATTQPCPHCHGTGLIRSDNSLGLTVLRAIEEEGTRRRSREVLVKAPVGIANYLINDKREHLAHIEARYGMAIRIEADPALVSPDFTLEKFKTATRIVAPGAAPVVSFDAGAMDAVEPVEPVEPVGTEEEVAALAPAEQPAADGETDSEGEGEGGGRRRRRRRRRRGGQKQDEKPVAGQERDDAQEAAPSDSEDGAEAAGISEPGSAEADAGEPPRKPARRRRASRKPATDAAPIDPQAADMAEAHTDRQADTAISQEGEPDTQPAPRRRSRRKPTAKASAEGDGSEGASAEGASSSAAQADPSATVEAGEAGTVSAAESAEADAPVDAEPTLATGADATPPYSRAGEDSAAAAEPPVAEPPVAEAPAPVAEAAGTPDTASQPDADQPGTRPEAPAAAAPAEADIDAPESEDAGTEQAAADTPEEKPDRPRRRGWWALRR